MLIIAGHAKVEADQRDAYVAAFHDMIRRCRAARGCLDIAITADSVDPSRVNILERWDNRENLEAWRAISDPPQTGIPFDADVMEYTVGSARPPFG
ncbi:putative quinol monooxygenase [Nocardia vulneris]|uniref:Antibiotic biosynthesis monooxygenase n=1 Tax=Nocardia vulneris TaxID=1141657 RepID=A0ABR4Z765_9NOCA|nr:antibiotic biosynthesis monooxygenase family protein [Nocardia vulneris]KIA61151.1 antibiotic biosynthesis monooxygenase [Nocardia vulneris]